MKNLKEWVKNWLDEKNPLVLWHRKKLRSELTNRTPTFLCPNCIGGILFHDLGLQFLSPTVNVMIFQNDFAKFVLNLDFYLHRELEFFRAPGYDCPCARLGDIVIHFTHYRTEEEARAKWQERTARIDPDNLFVFLSERDHLSYEMMQKLGHIPARGLVIFTAGTYPDLPYTLPVDRYRAEGKIGNILRKNHLTGVREYEKYFDFVKWFNEADGGSFDVSAFAKQRPDTGRRG